ncbi:Hypothetical predicted protein [Mytilus galloprovincialis]|uniref:Uncharacterized protein n=2 Tax=Mytilus galloprovincialis TaxID=29158 RepID=A0A8B6CHX8_MYTGA|nr:Hypothetical predicted protein [Mytilus galloprovincialis]
MEKRKKKDRDKVENMAPTKPAVHKKTIERIGSRSQKFKIEYGTVENVDRTGNELLANWKCLVQEKEEAIQTTSKRLQNIQSSKLSENRHNLQISIKDRLHYLRKQKLFLLDKQKTLNNVYKTIERSNRSRIPNPFPQFILDVKREHYQLFNEELLSSINKYERQIYAKEPSETILKLPQLLSDKEQTLKQEHPFTNRPGTSKLLPPLQNLPQNKKKTLIVNKIKDEKKDKSKVMSTEAMSKPAPQQPAETTASSEILDMNAELGSKRVRWKSKYQTVMLQKASRKNNYASERTYRFSRLHLSSGKKCDIPKSKSYKVSKMVNERYCTTRKQNRNVGKQTDREKTDRYPEPDQIHTLPRNMKETYIVNKIRKEKKEKSKVIPTQSTSISAPQKTTANHGTLDINSELALKRIKWENKLPTFRLQKASGKDCDISERKYQFSSLHKSSGKNCNIPKSKSNKVSKIVTEKYCTTRTQKITAKKQTEKEKLDSYPAQDQIHTWSTQQQADKTTASNKMSKSTQQQTDKTTASNKMSKSTQQQADETTASNKMSKSTQQQADETTTFNKMPVSTQQQNDKTAAFNKMSKSTQQQADETTVFNKMSKSTQQQANETTAFNKMAKSTQQTDETTIFIKMSKPTQQADETSTSNEMEKSTQQQADETKASNKMSKSIEQQADETTAFDKMSTSTQQQADETKSSNKMSKSIEQQAYETTTFNKMSKSTKQQDDETTAFNKMSKSAEHQAYMTTAFNKMSKSAEHQAYKTTAFNEMSKSAQQQVDETRTSNEMYESTEHQANETTAFNKMSTPTQQQAYDTTAFIKMSKPTQQQADEKTAFNKMSESTQQQADETKAFNKMSKSTQQQADETTPSNKMSQPTEQQADETTALNEMPKSTQQQADETKTFIKTPKSTGKQTDETKTFIKMPKSTGKQTDETKASNEIKNSTRKQNRNVRKQTVREKSNSYLKPDQTHSLLDIAVNDKYPTEDIFHKLDDNELIGFYQVQEKDLFPVIENMSDSKVTELFKKLHDQHIAVIQSKSNTVDDTQSSSSSSTIDDIKDAGENDGTLQTTMKTFVKKLIPDCITNGNQCQPTETLSSNWQIIKIRSGTNIKTRYIPMPPNTLKPKTSNARLKRYGRKKDENNNPPES